MSVRFVPLTAELLDWAIASHTDPTTAELWASSPDYHRRALAVPTLCYAMLGDGLVLGAGGVVFHWHGRAEAWWLVSRHATSRDLTKAVRFSRRFLDDRQRNPALRRVEMWVNAEQPWVRSFAEALGFRREGLALGWGIHGEDHFLFAKVTEG